MHFFEMRWIRQTLCASILWTGLLLAGFPLLATAGRFTPPATRPISPTDERCYALQSWQSQIKNPMAHLLCVAPISNPTGEDRTTESYQITLKYSPQGEKETLVAQFYFELIDRNESDHANSDIFDSVLPAFTGTMRIRFRGLRNYDRLTGRCTRETGTVQMGETLYTYEWIAPLSPPAKL